MNYLENMGENLELLDLVKKCNVTTYSLRSIRDKNTAIKNLKGLRVELLRVSPSYMRENPCELVKTEVLNHAEAVETINLLGEEDTLNLEEMILLGSFFSEHIPYDPKLLADCVKAVGVREKSKYMRIYYDLLANGKKNLFNSVLRFPRLAAAILQECDSSSQNTTHPRVCGLQYPPKVDISNQHNPQGWAYRWHCGSSAFRPDAISAPTTVPGNPSGSPRLRDT